MVPGCNSPGGGGTGIFSCRVVLVRPESNERGAAAWCRCLIEVPGLHVSLMMETGLLDLGAVGQRQEHCHLAGSTPCLQDIHRLVERRVSSMQECRLKRGFGGGVFQRSGRFRQASHRWSKSLSVSKREKCWLEQVPEEEALVASRHKRAGEALKPCSL